MSSLLSNDTSYSNMVANWKSSGHFAVNESLLTSSLTLIKAKDPTQKFEKAKYFLDTMYRIEQAVASACPFKKLLNPETLQYRVNLIKSYGRFPVDPIDIRLLKTEVETEKSIYSAFRKKHGLPASAAKPGAVVNLDWYNTTQDVVDQLCYHFLRMQKLEIKFVLLLNRFKMFEDS